MNNRELPDNLCDGRKLMESLDDEGFLYPIVLWMNLPDKKEWTLVFGISGLR